MKYLIIGAIVFVVGSIGLGSCSGKRLTEIRSEMGVVVLPNGNRMYEVEFDNIEYVIIERHNGIGICKK